MIIIGICIVGLIISLYGLYAERAMQQNALYKPACDISDRISCSKAFLSPYGTMFGISNTWVCVLYYLLMIALIFMGYDQLALFVSYAGVLVSAVFAYILYFKIQSLCIVCTSLYIVNIALAAACYHCFAG